MVSDEYIQPILAAIDRNELIDLTAELVSINSVWDPAAGTGEGPVADRVAQWAEKQGFQLQKQEVAYNRKNVVIRWPLGSDPRTLMFEGHTDVVTPGDVSAWQHDPFGAEIVGNRLYGRGSCDTKGNLAAMLIAMAALKRSGVPLNGTIIGGVLCDEEDRMSGVQSFIEMGYANTVTGAVICEPQDGRICIAQKGAIRAKYVIKGKMAHGAMPLAGLNTAPAVSRLIEHLHRLERKAVLSYGRDDLLGWPSVTPTVIQAPPVGSPQLNVLPGQADMMVDIRTLPTQSHSDMIRELKAAGLAVQKETRDFMDAYDEMLSLSPRSPVQVEMTVLTDRPCTRTDPADPLVQAAHWATRHITRKEPVYAGVPGSTDGTYLWSLKQIPIVTLGAGDRQIPHQVDEWVDLDQLLETAQIYALTALHYLS